MLKLIGALLLAGGAGALGCSAAAQLSRRVAVLRALLGALEGMEREIAFRLTPMPELLERACLRLGGTPMAGADVSFSLPFFEELRIAVQFWHGDDEFAPRLRVLWDANADQYLRYETMYYAIGLLKSRLRAYGGE